jgi:alkyl hydroperoxide reductase subunit AhpF
LIKRRDEPDIETGRDLIQELNSPKGWNQFPGIFAAGDVTDVPEKQIIIAAGEGSKASLSAFKYLNQRR